MRDIGPGLHVVQVGRAVVEALLGSVNILGPRLAHLAFQRGHERGGFAADESAAAAADLHLEVEAAAQDVGAEQSLGLGLLDGAHDILDGHGVLMTNIDVALV